MFRRILVANRGEIALRVIRACRELDIKTVAVYSDADRNALHVSAADEARHLGATPPAQSYLNVDRLIACAKGAHCDAIHPGYGFLAENAEFARRCAAEKITFIGPSPEAMERMGDKLAARASAQKAGVPVVPGTFEPVHSASAVRELAEKFGYPIAVKAAAGGGGKGLKVAHSPAEIDQALSLASREAIAYFADGRLYVERYIANAKHVEVQILGDKNGHVVHLGERDCSLQRRHQKLVEETPACISDSLRRRMHAAAAQLAQAIGYDSAGTIECLVEGDEFYFLEMNTRIQVEHTVTEVAYGFDLVKAQIRIATGKPLWVSQDALTPRGHAIECRINAESPSQGFRPCPGRIDRYVEPGGPGIRLDGAAFAGWEIGSDYDSLVAKLVAWGSDRSEAQRRMLRALSEYTVEGIETTIPFYELLLADSAFARGDYTTSTVDSFVRRNSDAISRAYEIIPRQMLTAQGHSNESKACVTVEVNDKQYRVRIYGLPPAGGSAGPGRARKYGTSKTVAQGSSSILAPMHGIVAELRVKPGDAVANGQVVAVIEAMKMMNEVIAHRSGTVQSVEVVIGGAVESGASILTLGK